MSLRIQNNIEAYNAHRQLAATSDKMSKSMERLSSGYRINRASDDAAGLAISEKLRAQIGGLQQAQRNVQDAVSLVQTGEGALAEVHSMLQRVRDLAVQYANGTLSDDDKTALRAEADQLGQETSRIASQTRFNGITLLGGDTVTFQIGVEDGQYLAISLADLPTDCSVSVFDLSQPNSISTIDLAISAISSARGKLGSVQNRLEHTLNNLGSYEENLTASESRIRDVDMASEMVNFTKLQILQQAGTAMLAQANQSPQNVLSLLRG